MMIALGSDSNQSCPGAVSGGKLNDRSHPVKSRAEHLPNEKFQPNSHFPLFLSLTCEAMCSETKQSRETRNNSKNSINADDCSPRLRKQATFSPSVVETYELDL